VTKKSKSTFVTHDSTEIVAALVGLKDVRVLEYVRDASSVYLLIEQIIDSPLCVQCQGPARVKERPVVAYVWICRRSGHRCGCIGANIGFAARTRSVQWVVGLLAIIVLLLRVAG